MGIEKLICGGFWAMKDIDTGVINWFQERGVRLQTALREALGRADVEVSFVPCPESPDGGMHIRVTAGNLEHQEHVWEEGLSDFDPDRFERCFQQLEQNLRSGHLQKRHGLVIVTYAPVMQDFDFMPPGFGHQYLN